MINLFSTNQKRRQKLSKFNLSHDKKLSFNMGELIPILLTETVPGDQFKVSTECMIRMAPMIAPIMHRVDTYVHYFFVPTRLLWDDFEKFITGGDQGEDAPTAPFMAMSQTNIGRYKKGQLLDYFGVPPIDDATTINQQQNISALPCRAYAQIWNQYYRDQSIQDEIPVATTSGGTTVGEGDAITVLQNRAWGKDYFTSALPWTQRGPAAAVPLQTGFESPEVTQTDGSLLDVSTALQAGAEGPGGGNQVIGEGFGRVLWNSSSEIDINDLRQSVRLQEWLERTARGGARYVEHILSHFGVKSSDARLNRPEYLGGGKSPMVISEVLNTTGAEHSVVPTDVEFLAQGNMSGHGISVGGRNKFRKRFEEHGYVIGLMSVLPKTSYQNGISRLWTRDDKFDYYWPSFAQLGEQAVKNRELFMDHATNTEGQADETFGYQSRYSEYKYEQSSVHADFRDTLDFWHMGRKFGNAPALNDLFIKSDPTERIFAVEDPDEDKLYAQVFNHFSALRPMPYFNSPTL